MSNGNGSRPLACRWHALAVCASIAVWIEHLARCRWTFLGGPPLMFLSQSLGDANAMVHCALLTESNCLHLRSSS